MKNFLYIALLALASCQYENELPKPTEYPQASYPNVENEIDSVRFVLSGDKKTTTGQAVFIYTANQTSTLNIKAHLWLSNPSYGFQYYISKNGISIGRNDVNITKNFNSSRDIVSLNIPVIAGDVITVNVGHASSGETTIHKNGNHAGFSNDESYLVIEAY
jgi:hypothetical protein